MARLPARPRLKQTMTFNGALTTTNLAAASADLSTAWKIEADYLYDGTPLDNGRSRSRGATTYFVRRMQLASWFTFMPMSMKVKSGTPGFGNTFEFELPTGTDYLMNVWLSFILPEVTLLTTNQYGVNGRLRWCRKIGHNIIEDCDMSASEQQITRLDNYILDLNYQFMIEEQRKADYDDMIGDDNVLTGPHGPGQALTSTMPAREINVPLPYFFTTDFGNSLPTAGLQFNTITFNFKFRNWDKLMILDNTGVGAAGTVARAVPVVPTDIATVPVLSNVRLWGNFALTNPIERKFATCTNRDIIIQQFQSMPRIAWNPVSGSPSYEPKFIFAVTGIMMAIRNKTFDNEWSNYTTASPFDAGANDVNFEPSGAAEPIKDLSVIYETTNRFANMPWSYFTKITPWYNAIATPNAIGYGLLSYSLRFGSLDPMGSTNYSRIAGVQFQTTPSAAALVAAAGTGAPGSGADFPQIWDAVLIARSFYPLRVTGGQLVFVFLS